MTIVNPHMMKAIADERIAELRRDGAHRREAAPKAKPTRRLKRSTKRTQAASPVRVDLP